MNFSHFKITKIISLSLFLSLLTIIFFGYNPSHASIFSKTPSVPPTLNSGLVGWWTMDGKDVTATTVTDKSGSGNNGTRNGTTAITTGKIGQAMKFDGTSGNINDATPPTVVTNDWTMSAWINPSNLNQLGSAVSNGLDNGVTGNGYAFGLGNGAGSAGDKLQGLLPGVAWLDPGYTFSRANAWYHVVMQRISGVTKFYVNGIQTANTSALVPLTPTDFNIGSQTGLRYFNGSIDDVRIYSRALSASEIMQLYKMGGGKINKTDATRPSLLSGLVGWWTMDGKDVTANTTTDKSGSGNDGTRNGGIKVVKGKLGQAMKFDGSSSKITLSPFTTGVNLTMSAWFKIANIGGQRPILNNYNISSQNGVYFGLSTGGKLFSYSLGSNPNGFEGTKVNNNNKWHFGVYTSNGVTSTFYIDGVLDKQIAQTRVAGSSGSFIGYGGEVADWWNGSIDDVRIYSRALSASEIMQLYKMGGGKINKTDATRPSLLSGLVGWWTMDGKDVTANTTTDKSGSGNDGTRTAVTPVPGKIGQAMKFNGTNSWINVGQAGATLTNNFTLSAWFKTTVNNVRLIARRPSSTQWDYYIQTNALCIYNNATSLCGSKVITDGKWHLGMVVVNGGNVQFYADGVPDGTASAMSFSTQTGDTNIGSIQNGAAGLMNGSLDDVRVYNRALSAREVMQLYRMGR